MLAEICPRPGCTMPLARSRSNRVLCTSCGLDVVAAAAAAPSRPTEQPKPEQEDREDRATNGPCSTAIVPARRVLSDAASAAVGDKLLQGWTMLEETCGNCTLPLLRDVGGRVVCVACQRDAPPQASGTEAGRGVEGEGRELVMRGSTHVMGNGSTALGSPVHRGPLTRDASPVRRGTANGVEREENRRVPRVGGGRRRLGALPMAGSAGGGGQASPMAVGTRMPDEHDGEGEDVDLREELRLIESELARGLRCVRRRMEGRNDVEGLRVMATTIQELAKAVVDIKDARRLVAYED